MLFRSKERNKQEKKSQKKEKKKLDNHHPSVGVLRKRVVCLYRVCVIVLCAIFIIDIGPLVFRVFLFDAIMDGMAWGQA